MKNQKIGKVIIPANTNPWPHEIKVATILASAGHNVIFLKKSNLHTADILLDNMEFEIKSPKSANSNSLEHLLKKALKQSSNIIIDTVQMKNSRDDKVKKFLISQIK
ncbi:hypothetical protein IKG33_02605 [Candidatus Saccharibacteria bacterium]|nr:hypothetical protein [Candidatus Saccharibacteria bacterium]